MINHQHLLKEAVQLAIQNRNKGERPFGAIIAKNEQILSTGVNSMLRSHDPSSHAELEAIRSACKHLGQLDLKGCTVYASGHPCPMCIAAILMSNIETVYYAFDNEDAVPYGLSSEATYQKLGINLESVPLKLIKLDVGMKASALYGAYSINLNMR